MSIVKILYGISTFIPGVQKYFHKTTGGTSSARYCYSVWLRHLVMAKRNGLDPYPKIVAELGPGDSLGIGLAALISGCDQYYALDVVEYANSYTNKKIFEEIVDLFENKSPIPDNNEFPKLKPYLQDYSFPHEIMTDLKLNKALDPVRIEQIMKSVTDGKSEESMIRYVVPWWESSLVHHETIDLIYSQAVLEHVDDLMDTIRTMRFWLKKGGYMSHQIDFKSHSTSEIWNGHWTYSDLKWKLIRGKMPFLINREPHSNHIAHIVKNGFKIICDETYKTNSMVLRKNLAPKFRGLSDEDLNISGAFIQAIRE